MLYKFKCGHDVEGENFHKDGVAVMYKSEYDGERCVTHATYCQSCAETLSQQDIFLKTRKDADIWLGLKKNLEESEK